MEDQDEKTLHSDCENNQSSISVVTAVDDKPSSLPTVVTEEEAAVDDEHGDENGSAEDGDDDNASNNHHAQPNAALKKDLTFAPSVADQDSDDENKKRNWELGPETLDDNWNPASVSPEEAALALKAAADATSNFTEDKIDTEESELPEGGWGWMIVVGLFVLMVCLFGTVFSLSVYFVEWMPYFDATATEISWAISLCPLLGGLSSPVAGVLCTRFGSRKIALFGSALTFASVFLAVFSQTVVHLYITLGVMLGIGISLVWSPSLVMLGQYFHRRYVLANSIAFCGYSFAQIIVPKLTQILIEEYGWRGAMLIQSAMISHMFVTASLLRPRIAPEIAETLQTRPSISSIQTRPSFSHFHEKPHTNGKEMELTSETKEIWTSTTSLHMFDNIMTSSSGNKSTTVLFEDDIDTTDTKRTPLTIINKCVSFLKVTYGLSALSKRPLYLVTVACSLGAGIGWFVTSIHLVARAVNAGISESDAAFLLTVLGIASFVGRAGHGVVIDKKLMGRQMMFTVTLGCTGVLSLFNPFMDTFPLLCVYSVLYGFNHGIANSLVYAMMKLQVSKNEAAAALSFGTLVFAASNTAGGVIAGALFDATGGYDIPFYFAAAAILSGTLVSAIVFTINYWRKDKLNLQSRRRSLFLRSHLYAQ